MNEKTPDPKKPAEAPRARPADPSPSERHPGQKPEEADSKFEDLTVREHGNRR